MGCFHIPHHASSNSWCRSGTMSLGSDLFYEPFKEDGSLLTIEECRKSEELANPIKYSHALVYKICLFSFGHHDVEAPVWPQVPGRLEERWDHLKNIRHFPPKRQTRRTSHSDQRRINQLKLLMSTLPSCDSFSQTFELNSVSFVHTFQWVWTDSYLCVLVTRAIFHPFDWTPVLCAS